MAVSIENKAVFSKPIISQGSHNCSRARVLFRFSFIAVARNRVVAGGWRLLSKNGQQLITGTAFKYVIARLMLAFCRDVYSVSSLSSSPEFRSSRFWWLLIYFRHLPFSFSRVGCHVSRVCIRTRQYLVNTSSIWINHLQMVSILRGITLIF